MSEKCDHTGMYELLEAIEAAIESAEQPKRDALKRTINAYMEDFPEEYFWAIGPQSPTLLSHIMHAIEPASVVEESPAQTSATLEQPSVYESRGFLQL